MAGHTGATVARLRPAVTRLTGSFAVMATTECPSVTEDTGLPRAAHPPASMPVERSERKFLLLQREAFALASGSGPAYITGKDGFAVGY